jgi:hypothetical protein
VNFPTALLNTLDQMQTGQIGPLRILFLVAMAVVVIGAIIFVERGHRRITVQYAKRVVGRRQYGGSSTHIPLKVNTGGVIPVIFASSILAFPLTMKAMFPAGSFFQRAIDQIDYGMPLHNLLYLVGIIFLPVFFTVVKGMPPDVAGQVVAPMGITTMICGFMVPFISDRIGRKPAMIIFTFIGLVTPIAALHFAGPQWMLSLLLLIGWTASGSFAVFMGVIPSETVPKTLAASSMGLVVGAGEIVGGVLSPTISGWIADQTSLVAHMVVMMVCALCGGLLSLLLRETAPGKVKTAEMSPEPAYTSQR